MATATRKCKVCGCEYEYCHTARRVAGVFRYQDVACCPEHGSIYLAKVIEARSKANTATTDGTAEFDESSSLDYESDEYEDDELFEEEFDDDADEPAIETI